MNPQPSPPTPLPQAGEGSERLHLDEELSRLDSRSLSELATIQGVEALPDVRVLFGTWPGNDDDDFEASIQALRVRS